MWQRSSQCSQQCVGSFSTACSTLLLWLIGDTNMWCFPPLLRDTVPPGAGERRDPGARAAGAAGQDPAGVPRRGTLTPVSCQHRGPDVTARPASWRQEAAAAPGRRQHSCGSFGSGGSSAGSRRGCSGCGRDTVGGRWRRQPGSQQSHVCSRSEAVRDVCIQCSGRGASSGCSRAEWQW